METTWEQVDITASGPNSYLWLKNTAKIHILIHTLMLENENVERKQIYWKTSKYSSFGYWFVPLVERYSQDSYFNSYPYAGKWDCR